MRVVTVELEGLYQDLDSWRVPHNYVRFFISKCQVVKGRVSLASFMFNDTEHMTNPRQWLAANAAFWCRAYRESQQYADQAQALGAIQSVNAMAGMLGHGDVVTLIHSWWGNTFELHQLPQLNSKFSQCPDKTTIH